MILCAKLRSRLYLYDDVSNSSGSPNNIPQCVTLNNPQKLDTWQRPGSNGRFQCESGEIPTSWLLGTQDEIEMEWKYSFSALSIRLSNSLHSLLHLARTYNCRTRFQFTIWFLSTIERGKETEI